MLLPLENQSIGKELSHLKVAVRDQMRVLKNPQDSRDVRFVLAQAKNIENMTRTIVAKSKQVRDKATARKLLHDVMTMYKIATSAHKDLRRILQRGQEGTYTEALLKSNLHDAYGGIWGYILGIRKTYGVKMYRVKGRTAYAKGQARLRREVSGKSMKRNFNNFNNVNKTLYVYGRALSQASRGLAQLRRAGELTFDTQREFTHIYNFLIREVKVTQPLKMLTVGSAILQHPEIFKGYVTYSQLESAHKAFMMIYRRVERENYPNYQAFKKDVEFLIRWVADYRKMLKNFAKAWSKGGANKRYGVKSDRATYGQVLTAFENLSALTNTDSPKYNYRIFPIRFGGQYDLQTKSFIWRSSWWRDFYKQIRVIERFSGDVDAITQARIKAIQTQVRITKMNFYRVNRIRNRDKLTSGYVNSENQPSLVKINTGMMMILDTLDEVHRHALYGQGQLKRKMNKM